MEIYFKSLSYLIWKCQTWDDLFDAPQPTVGINLLKQFLSFLGLKLLPLLSSDSLNEGLPTKRQSEPV